MRKIKVLGADSWQSVVDPDPERLKEGIAKMRQALEEDEKREREKGSGLPKDWRNRIIKEAAAFSCCFFLWDVIEKPEEKNSNFPTE